MPPIAGLRAVQDRLHALNLYPSPGDGEWGPRTEASLDAALSLLERAQGVTPPAIPLLPARYRWLLAPALQPLPKTITAGLALLGTLEKPGAGDSETIMGWAKELGLASSYSADSVAWCGLFAAVVAKRAGKTPPANPLWARNWLNFGEPVAKPGLGDILVFRRGAGGHVAFYVGEDAEGYFHILGGNQGDAVNIMRKRRRPGNEDGGLLGARRPAFVARPASVRPFMVAASGEVSTREA